MDNPSVSKLTAPLKVGQLKPKLGAAVEAKYRCMTEKEVIQKQEENGNTVFYLTKHGSFYHANGHGAFALSRATGYQAMRKHRKAGDIVQTGFGVGQLPKVLEKIKAAGGTVKPLVVGDDDVLLFSGIDGTPDESMVAPSSSLSSSPCKGEVSEGCSTYSSSPCKGEVSEGRRGNDFHWLADALRNFNLSAATPLEAMLFRGERQDRGMAE